MGKRGRPGKEPSEEERQKVKDLVAERASHRLIATALGRSVPNLRKHFQAELISGKKIAGEKNAPFKITKTMRSDVALMAGCHEPLGRIAKAIGCTEEQLEEFFADDLSVGAAKYRLKILKRTDQESALGKNPATRQLEALTAAPDSGEPAPARGAAYVGKKAAARADAQAATAAGGKFAPRPAPRVVVDNT